MKIIQIQEWNGWLIGLDDDGHLYKFLHEYMEWDEAMQEKEAFRPWKFHGWERLSGEVLS